MKRLILAAVVAVVATGATADEFEDGAMMAMSCAACHGTDGASPGVMPSLVGQSRAFINNRMVAFRSGKRPSTVMGRIAKGYTDDEIAAIAKHFSKLEQE
jgi:sulfide dehydrogenase cytochrome subunit